MSKHKVYISTNPAKDQKKVKNEHKYKVGSAVCVTCGWDTPLGLEHTSAYRTGIFEQAMQHLADHDSLGNFDYNDVKDLARSWKKSLSWACEEQMWSWGILKEEEE